MQPIHNTVFRIIVVSVMTLALVRPVMAASNVSINPPAAPSAVAAAELQLTVTFDAQTITPPGTVLLTFILTNTGSNTAKNVSIDNLLPIEFAYRDPAAAKSLTQLGELRTGDSITKSLTITIPSAVRTNRYVDEAIASASNAASIESIAAIDVRNGQVLGATDSTISTLATTGQSPLLVVLSGLLLIGTGIVILKTGFFARR